MAGYFSILKPWYWTCLRWAVAMVWLYQGAWHKILAVDEHHLSIVAAVPLLGLSPSIALALIGLAECAIGAAVVLKLWPRFIAWLQVGLLALMNAGGIIFAGEKIPDPAGMVLMNLVFLFAALGCGYAAHGERS